MKRSALLFFCLCLSTLALAQIPTTDLVGEYKFTNGRLDDAIGNNDLTQTGSALVFENNRAAGPTKAVSLNGDYLQRAATSDTDITASFWIKTTTNDAISRVIIDQSERTTSADISNQKGWYTYLKDGKIGLAGNYFYHYNTNTTAGANVYTGYKYGVATTDVSDGNWHHVSITTQKTVGSYYKGGNQFTRYVRNIYKIYIDGVLENTNSVQMDLGTAIGIYMQFLNGAPPVTIANSKDGNSTDRYQDEFDDFRLYSRALDATEVGQLAAETACSGTSGVTATTQDITILLDASGNASIVAADIDNGSSAVCDEPFTLSIDKTAFTCDDLGTNIVTLTATETYGTQAVSTATATVTVTYTPEVIAQDITVQLDASGNATITPSDINNGSPETGVCGAPLSYSLDITTFTCADIGTNVVTLTADDGDGNTGTATATVTVEDQIAPTIIAQNLAVQVDNNLGYVTITAAQVDNGSTDNCDSGSLTMSLSKTKFTCEDTGDNTVTLTVEDLSGNMATADVTVTVTSDINDEVITATTTETCLDGSSGSTISTDGSVIGFNYSLRNSANNNVVDGPIAGTGSGLDFSTGNLSQTTTFNVFAEKILSTTQSALDFDGIDDYVSLGTDNKGITDKITIAAWIKTSTTGSNLGIIQKYDGANGYLIYIDPNGKVKLDGRDGNGGYKTSGTSTTSVNDGEWHYVVGTINSAPSEWKIYVDGVLENENSGGTSYLDGSNLASTSTAFLGNAIGPFKGAIDQFTIWDTVLDAATIATNMNTCFVGNETNIVGHYIFEDGSGTTLTDQSTSALNGTLTNMDGASDWVQVISPSCGEKACNYQLSTEITVGDAIAPTVVAQNITAEIDADTGEVTITADMIDNGSTDNCSTVLTKSISKSTFDCEDIGDQIITLTIEDASGNTSTAEVTVTVISPIADETITTANSTDFCPDGSAATISTGSSVLGVNYYLRNSEDNTIIDGPIAGTGSGLDFSTGNISSTSTFNVYAKIAAAAHSSLDFDGVDDKIVTSYIPPATNGLTVELWMKPTLTSYSRVISSYQGSSSVLAGEIVLDTYYDANTNNGKALRFIVSGAGNTTFSFGAPNVLTLNAWNHVAATFDNGVIRLYVDGMLVGTSGTASFTSLPLGTSTVSIGEDRIQGGAEYFQGEMDEIRIWSTAKSESEILANKDKCLDGTETGLELYYNLNENTALVATDLAGANNGTLTNMDANTDWVTSGVDITCGAICDLQMTTEITLGDNAAPTALAQDITVQLDASGNATITTGDVDNGSSDNCTAAESLVLNLDITAFTCADLGTNTVTLTVADAQGNEATATATVTVEDTILPTASAQNITLQLDAIGNATITTADINNGSEDNCTSIDNLVVSIDKTDFTCADIGENTVTLTVADAQGNEASATATVTVVDNIAPTVVAQNITLQLDAEGNATLTAAEVNNGSSDNCNSANTLVISIDKTDFTCADLGENTVTLTVSDDSGNTATAEAVITIEDSILPTAIAQEITVRLDANNSATITVADIDNGSSDNCGNVSMSLDITTFNESKIGTNQVVLTVEDGSGNSSTATAVVTVEPYKQTQIITFEAIADKIYGDADFDLDASINSSLAIDFSVISGPATLSGSTITMTGAGTVVVEAAQTGNDDYLAASEQITFIVNKAALTVSADNKTINYGDEFPALTITYEGFVNGEDASTLDEVPTPSTTATATSERGSYPITLTEGSDNNYALTHEEATLTITGPEFTLPEALAFSTLALGHSTVEVITINNTGDGSLDVTGISLPEGYSISQYSFSIAAGSNLTLNLTFNPLEPKSYSGSLVITSNIGESLIILNGEGQVITGVDDEVLDSEEVKLFPNPSSETLNIDLSKANINQTKLKLVNLNGVVQWEASPIAKRIALDVSSYPGGLYLLIIESEKGSTTKKVIIKH